MAVFTFQYQVILEDRYHNRGLPNIGLKTVVCVCACVCLIIKCRLIWQGSQGPCAPFSSLHKYFQNDR